MEERGQGWILYSVIVLLVAGGLGILEGIVALNRSVFFTQTGAHYVTGTLRTWGWLELIVGIVAVLAGISALYGGAFGRWAGILVAAISIFAQMFWVPIVPFWALTVMFLDALVIYGLAVYGGRRQVVEATVTETEREREIRAA
ncbi:MAG TPA: hypothetical protein VK576_09525 [Thermoleophilia bacterium]|nr:hypothetical protein [Thermoleophilia bacterium]